MKFTEQYWLCIHYIDKHTLWPDYWSILGNFYCCLEEEQVLDSIQVYDINALIKQESKLYILYLWTMNYGNFLFCANGTEFEAD